MVKDIRDAEPKGWHVEATDPGGLHASARLVQPLYRASLDARKQLEASLALAQSHALTAWESRVASPQQGFVQGLQELAQRLPAVTIPGSSSFSGTLRVVDDPLSRSLRSFRASGGKELTERGEKGRIAEGFRLNSKIGSGEWDILKSLDKNLRNLEKAFIEGAVDHERRVRAAARTRAKMAQAAETVSARPPHGAAACPFVLFLKSLWNCSSP